MHEGMNVYIYVYLYAYLSTYLSLYLPIYICVFRFFLSFSLSVGCIVGGIAGFIAVWARRTPWATQNSIPWTGCIAWIRTGTAHDWQSKVTGEYFTPSTFGTATIPQRLFDLKGFLRWDCLLLNRLSAQ